MNNVMDVAIVGGGAIGCSVAYHAAARGARVALFEAEWLGGGASGALAGMLSGGIEHLSDAPICGVFELHANFTETMARQSDGLIAYRENPCTDTKEAAKDAALLLDGLMQVEDRPATVWDHPPILWSPGGTATDFEPMLTLEECARQIEASPQMS